ncbi:hypothetical protein ACQ4PT_033436 [Festuca glaucescens]
MARYLLPSTTTTTTFSSLRSPRDGRTSPAPILVLRGFASRSKQARPIMAVASEKPTAPSKFPKVAAPMTGPIPADELLGVIQAAAKAGAEVVMEAVNKPRNIQYKGTADLVTDTDKLSESVILEVVTKNFKDHLILGEEGGIIGDSLSEYLWCIDPLDGTTNFAHGYPSFSVSIGVLFRGKPAAATVVEFCGGPMCWSTRTISASSGNGAYCNGQKIHVSPTDKVEQSLLVTGFGYEHDDPWLTNINLFKEFTDISRKPTGNIGLSRGTWLLAFCRQNNPKGKLLADIPVFSSLFHHYQKRARAQRHLSLKIVACGDLHPALMLRIESPLYYPPVAGPRWRICACGNIQQGTSLHDAEVNLYSYGERKKKYDGAYIDKDGEARTFDRKKISRKRTGAMRGRGWKYGSGFVDGVFPVLSPMAQDILELVQKGTDVAKVWESLDSIPATHNLWDDILNVAVQLRLNRQWDPIITNCL